MLEILNIKPINKGVLLASCDVRIPPWRTTYHEIKIFEKGAQRWIALPSREFINDAGEKKYIEQISFDTEEIKNRFRAQIMTAVDKFLESNPDMAPEDLIKEDDGVPF